MVKLTDTYIKALKPRLGDDGKARMTTVPDASTPGLEVYVTPKGAKTFSLRYTLEDGTRRRMNLGRYPALAYADARELALEHMRTAAKGGDPATVRKQAKDKLRARTVRTVGELLTALFEASETTGVRATTLTYWRWLERKHVGPRLGEVRLEALAPGMIRKALREIGGASGPTTGNRAFGLLRRAFNFALEEEHLAVSPMARMKPLFDEASRTRVLSDAEIKALWQAAEASREPPRKGKDDRDELAVSRAMGCAVQLCLLTVQRGGEVIGMTAAELDLEQKLWTLPAERTKAGREHVVPLTDAAIELIQEASTLAALRLGRAPKGGDPIFPTPRVGTAERDDKGALVDAPKPVARLSLGRAMSRLCLAAKLKDASAHDLRRTASTVMAGERVGALNEVVARVLNHSASQGVTGVYNRHAYLAEKRAALTRWAAVVAEIVGAEPGPSNVRQLRA